MIGMLKQTIFCTRENYLNNTKNNKKKKDLEIKIKLQQKKKTSWVLLFSFVYLILHKIIAMEILIHEYLNIMNEASEKL